MSLTSTHFSTHAIVRMAQRGFRDSDADWIVAIGTEVEGGYLVRKKDVQELTRQLKHMQQILDRLAGKRLVVDGGTVVTGYHAKRSKLQKLLNNQ